MRDRHLPRERPPEGASAAPGAVARLTFTLWMVAAFLGAFVAAHSLVQRALAGG